MSNDEMTTSLIINNDENIDNSSRNGGELINRDENYFDENDLSQSEYENEVPDTFDNLTNAKKRYHHIKCSNKVINLSYKEDVSEDTICNVCSSIN